MYKDSTLPFAVLNDQSLKDLISFLVIDYHRALLILLSMEPLHVFPTPFQFLVVTPERSII